MSRYFILHYDITNPEGFKNYTTYVSAILQPWVEKGKAKVLVVNRKMSEKVIEGNAKSDLVLVEFDSQKSFDEFYKSPKYQDIIKYRIDNTEGWVAFI